MALFDRSRARRATAGKLKIKAILFDVFGTTVDWKHSMTAYAEKLGTERGVNADWAGLVAEWRDHYKPAIQPVREGKRKWAGFDLLHREELDKIVAKYGARRLSSADRDLLVKGWHYLTPWPDTVPGLQELWKCRILAPLSNGTTRQLVDMARHAGLPWDMVFGADQFGTYKPAPQVYLGAARLLGLHPGEILMVAAHNDDLRHAALHGMMTCFVHRPTEDAEPTAKYTYVVKSFEELAGVLGAV